ncbi:MAG: hypothetical protein KKE37_04525 [Verrucomicrobia bacterium]|nr:hypothetical protein [Verrucomicrobiota bacterium]MBU4291754.1 hypothetical protein [Verrucomicrobiota bacterium]MBU4428602.1 hypothetical protein [Verrucomicrobiota bacterium]MCG2679344.1 hypothetical protein [Kiritimatiellia bacterium]
MPVAEVAGASGGYIGEFSTGNFGVGKGTVTLYAQDAAGRKCQVVKAFEVRSLHFVRADGIGTDVGKATGGERSR